MYRTNTRRKQAAERPFAITDKGEGKMSKGKSKMEDGRQALASAFEAADSYIFAARATAREGVENPSDEDQKRFLVIEDLLKLYRKTIYAAIDGKAA
jgi:hypothetical protein